MALKPRIIVVALLFACCCWAKTAHAQNLEWVVNGGGTDIKTDRAGRVYVAGSFLTDSIKIGNIVLRTTSSGDYTSYVARYSAQGNVIWAKTEQRISIGYLGIAEDGYIYVAGGSSLGKFDSLGNTIWIKSINQNCRGFCLDKNGNSFFIGTNSTGMFYAAKFDSSGNTVWAKSYGSAGTAFIQNIHIGVDGQGNLYACDGIADYVAIGKATYFNPYPGGEGYSSYLFKISNAGNLAWSKYMDFDGIYGANVAVDSSGDIYLTSTSRLGVYSDSAVFDTIVLKESNLNGGGETESITVKFDSSGKAIWGRHIPSELKSTNDSSGSSGISDANPPIALNRNGDIYIAGNFEGSIKFENKPYYFNPYAGSEGFYAKYNNNGKEQGFIPLGYLINGLNTGVPGPQNSSICLDAANNFYFTGGHEGTDLFMPDTSLAGFMTGKLSAFPIIMPDSMSYTNDCKDSFRFNIYYNTTPDSVLWSFGDGTQSRQFQPLHSYTKAGTYIVKLTAYVLGQVKSFSDTVTYVIFPSKLLPKDTILCVNSVLNINCTVPLATSYLWNNGDTVPMRTLSQAGYYKITVSGGGCSKSDSFNLVYDNHGYNLGNDTILCPGDILVLAGPTWPNDKYTWNTGDTALLLYVTTPNTYWLHVFDGVCHFADTINVKYDFFPSRVMPSDTVICTGHPIPVSIKNFSGSILWQDNKTDSDYIINSSGTYSVTLKNQCGTKTYASTIADSNCNCYLFIPNVFTPNKDHVNDIFYAQSDCELITYSLQIYNRWGEMVFKGNDMSTGWDGTFKGIPSPSGVYVYKIIYKFQNATEQIRSGTVVIN